MIVSGGERKIPFQVRMYFYSRIWYVKACKALHACWVGLWLGAISPDKLYATVEEYYIRSGRDIKDGHTNYHSGNYNRNGLFIWEKEAIKEYFGGCKRLLVLGVGGGREVLALLKLGYQVDGFESNQSLVVAANELLREEGFDPAVRWIEPDRVPDTGTTYDGIVVGWAMYMSIQTRKRRIAFLRQLRTHTRMQGPILISFVARGDVLSAAQYRVGVTIANMIRRVLRREPAEVGDWLGPMYARHFKQDEITLELAEGGFKSVHYGTSGFGNAVGIAV